RVGAADAHGCAVRFWRSDVLVAAVEPKGWEVAVSPVPGAGFRVGLLLHAGSHADSSPDTGVCGSADLAWLRPACEAWAGMTPLRKRIGLASTAGRANARSRQIPIRFRAQLRYSRGFTGQLYLQIGAKTRLRGRESGCRESGLKEDQVQLCWLER